MPESEIVPRANPRGSSAVPQRSSPDRIHTRRFRGSRHPTGGSPRLLVVPRPRAPAAHFNDRPATLGGPREPAGGGTSRQVGGTSFGMRTFHSAKDPTLAVYRENLEGRFFEYFVRGKINFYSIRKGINKTVQFPVLMVLLENPDENCQPNGGSF